MGKGGNGSDKLRRDEIEQDKRGMTWCNEMVRPEV